MAENKWGKFVGYGFGAYAMPVLVTSLDALSGFVAQLPDFDLMGISLLKVGLGTVGIWLVDMVISK